MKSKTILLLGISLFLFSYQASAVQETHPLLHETSESAKVETYEELLNAIRAVQNASQERIEQAVEQEKVREAWETGRLIDSHVLFHKERADYGKQVLDKLTRDLGTSQSELSYMLQFARAYPIYPQADKLSWAHYRELLSVNDPQQRNELAAQVEKEGWGRDELRAEVRRRQIGAGTSNEEPLVPLKGELNTYRVVTALAQRREGKENLVLDLGFSNYYRPPGEFNFNEGDIVRVEDNGGLVLVKSATESLQPLQIPQRTAPTLSADAAVLAQPAQVFSYRAYVLEVTDGDTLWVLVDLGFDITTKQHLRLRGLDAPEIESAEGQEAKRFMESELADVPSIVITSSKSDKYDRYLADVWAGDKYLNQALIDQGLAVRVNE